MVWKKSTWEGMMLMESGQSPLHAVLEKEVYQLMDESNVRKKWKSFKEIEFYVL